jgi:hypothetical protein
MLLSTHYHIEGYYANTRLETLACNNQHWTFRKLITFYILMTHSSVASMALTVAINTWNHQSKQYIISNPAYWTLKFYIKC